MLKYGCSGVSWKNADMDILLHLDFCPMANLRPKRNLFVDPKEKGKSGCYWSPSRTPDEPPGVVSSPTNELHRLFPCPLCFPVSVLLKHAELNVKHSAKGSTEDWHS